MIHHLKMKLSFLTLILISLFAYGADEITISKAFIKMPRPGVDVTAGLQQLNLLVILRL